MNRLIESGVTVYFEPSFEGKDIETCEHIIMMFAISSDTPNAQEIFDLVYGWAIEYGGGFNGAREAVKKFGVEHKRLNRKIDEIFKNAVMK